MQLEGQADKGEFVTLIPGQLLEEEIFYDINAVTYKQDEMAGQRDLEFGIEHSRLIPGHLQHDDARGSLGNGWADSSDLFAGKTPVLRR